MRDMTDSELEEKIAYIEGTATRNCLSGGVDFPAYLHWDRLGVLIEKYEISISFNFCIVSMITNKQHELNFTDIPSLKRKCLQLIIKAHKELNK